MQAELSKRNFTAAAAEREEEEQPSFERADAEAASTHRVEAGALRRGSFVMLKGRPCKIVELDRSKTGKHGRTKAHVVGLDIFTGRKYEDMFTTSESVSAPFVRRTEYQLVNLSAQSGHVSVLTEQGELRSDLNLPCSEREAAGAEASDEDKKIQQELVRDFEAEKICFVTVLAACGQERIAGHRAEK